MNNKVVYPRVHLTLDACFAIKRWSKPSEWARIVNGIQGIQCIEMSTDLDIDPQFTSPAYREKWINEVKEMEQKYNLKIVSFFSSYVTYRALGLLNWEQDIRDLLVNNYHNKTVDMASELGACVGSTLHAFSEEVLNDPAKFETAESLLIEYLCKMTAYASSKNVLFAYEQMYTPNQGWWRIDDCERYLRQIMKDTGKPCYVAIDSAHMCAQKNFVFPNDSELEQIALSRSEGVCRFPKPMLALIHSGTTVVALKEAKKRFEYYFTKDEDSDVYSWLDRMGCYSPIIHLQQTDGTFSSHKPFISKYNDRGIIHPRRILQAIAKSYEQPEEEGMPPRVRDIYLAFEIFFGITTPASDIVKYLQESADYWRQVMKSDGETVDRWL